MPTPLLVKLENHAQEGTAASDRPASSPLLHRLLTILALGLYALMARDGRLYWHDVRYLYGTWHYSLSELFAGIWNPQFGEKLNAAASGAFYLVKFSFLMALKGLWKIAPPQHGGLGLGMALSLLLAATVPFLAAAILTRLTGKQGHLPAGTAWLLLISPTLPYLGGKLLAEVLALPLALASFLALLAAWPCRHQGRRRLLFLAAFLLYVTAICARVNISILVVGGLTAGSMVLPAGPDRKRLLRAAALATALQAAVLVILFWLEGPGWAGFSGYLLEFTSQHHSGLISVAGGLAAAGGLTPLAVAGLFSHRRRAVAFLTWWLGLTLIPTVALVALYQVEARYLVAPLIPLAGLAWLGVDRILARSSGKIRAFPIWRAACLAVGLLAVNGLALSVLPWEVDTRALDGLMNGPELSNPRSTLLVPWGYTDYHYLVTLYPERSIKLIHVPRRNGRLITYSEAWKKRLHLWYGGGFVAGMEGLRPLLRHGPVYELSWERHPPLERWADRLAAWHLEAAAQRLRSLAGLRHGQQTWLVEEDAVHLVPVRRAGQYSLRSVQMAPLDKTQELR